MTVSTEKPAGGSAPIETRRAGPELLLEVVFRPVANAFVSLFARAGVAPQAVVLANAAVGLVAAAFLARGDLIAAAVLLQVKTLLDNLDGQLARATGRVTLAGRYLDTVADLIVNAAVFAALGYVTGQPFLAASSFVALTLVLAVDFNVTELYREARGLAETQPPATGSGTERVLARIYGLVFAPLDRGIGQLGEHADVDRLTVTALANLGLSTQLVVLGACLALGAPVAYLWFVLGCLLLAGALLGQAERRGRSAL
jgi:archaetidylinositol phosphate synthase